MEGKITINKKYLITLLLLLAIFTPLTHAEGESITGATVKPASLRLQSPVPVIGAWFPQENEMKDPDGYRDFLDAAAEHSHYTILSTTMRNKGRQMVDPYVHDWFKRAAQYAKDRGMGIVLEMDPRHSISAFKKKYPCLLYTSPSPRDRTRSRMPSSA